MNGLVLAENVDNRLVLYNNMCTAITVCSNVDECKDIINKSVAVTAYYKQIKDEETTQKFYRVRLRAWRRIAELFATVDISQCTTLTSKAQKVRAIFGPAVDDMSDSRINEVLRLSTISDADFEYAISQKIRGTVADLFTHTPQSEEMRRKNQKQRDNLYTPLTDEEIAEEEAEEAAKEVERQKQARKREMEGRHLTELTKASEAALQEVGLTLERKDRAKMKQVVFLIKEEVHKVMRQAAFDQQITMQEILRRGLKMWLIAHDYKFPDA